MLDVIESFSGFHKHIVDIGFHGIAQQRSEYLSYQSLMGCPSILQSKAHHIITVYPMRCNEGLFLHVKMVHRNLMISREGVQK